MKINVSAGHNPAGKIACGAVSILNESAENRKVKNEVIRQLRLMGHTVYDCTVDDGKNAADVLSKCVAKCNANQVDIDIQIHFNAGANDTAGNGKNTGTEVFIYDDKSTVAKKYALDIVSAIERIGFKNRGIKTSQKLFYLRRTNAQAVLIECCFVDDKDDAQIYDATSMATAIVYGLTGKKLKEKTVTTNTEAEAKGAETKQGKADEIYRVQVGSYRNLKNAKLLKKELNVLGFKSYITKE